VSADDAFELSAAGLRFDGVELSVAVELLARKLEEALPNRTRTERRAKRLLSSQKQVRSIDVELGPWVFSLRDDDGRVEGWREKRVGGIAIRREPLDLSAWIVALTGALQAEAQRSDEARAALAQLLG
jgi:hypothetical protein